MLAFMIFAALMSRDAPTAQGAPVHHKICDY